MVRSSWDRKSAWLVLLFSLLACLPQFGCANKSWWRSNAETDVNALAELNHAGPLPTADLRRHGHEKTGRERSTAPKITAARKETHERVSASLSDDPTDEETPPQPLAANNALVNNEPVQPARPARSIPIAAKRDITTPRPSLEELIENNWPAVASHVAKKLEGAKLEAVDTAQQSSQTSEHSAANANTQRLPNTTAAAESANQLRPVIEPVLEKQTVQANLVLAPAEPESYSDRKTMVDPQVAKASATSANETAAIKPGVVHLPATSDSAKSESSAAYQAGDWLKQRDKTIAALEEEIRTAKKDAARHSEVPHLETLLRLQYSLAGRRDDAARSIDGLHEAEQEFWKHEAFGLVDLLAADRLASESRRYAVALQSLEEAQSHLAAAGTLALKNIAFCRKVDDFGRVDKFDRYDFSRNQEVLLYVEARNFAAVKGSTGYETELQGSFRVLDRGGTARSERLLPLDRQTCSNHRRDYYIAYRIYIPAELSPGAYSLELTLEDKKGNKSNNALLDFNVTK